MTTIQKIIAAVSAIFVFGMMIASLNLSNEFPPCEDEDSIRNCYWDADTRGNGIGRSFYVLNGEVFYAN